MFKRSVLLFAALLLLVPAGMIQAQSARDYISIVGSSTVYPFATVVAETFGKTTKYKTPKIESTGSGGGFKLFCAGVGVEHPDITNASRRMKKSECQMCQENGVEKVTEVRIGYDGIVLANSKKSKQVSLSRKDIFLALAKEVPAPSGAQKLVPNPYKTWNDVNPDLPKVKIEVLGPPPTSGTRDAFGELAMEEGAGEIPFMKELKEKDKKMFGKVAVTMREDGAYIEAGENDNLIVQKLEANPDAFGIFGFSFLDQNTDKIQGSKINGATPTFDNIADGDYPLSRPLFFYIKQAHVDVIPGMKEYVKEFTSAKAWGEDGYLSEKGLIPMPEQERNTFQANVRNLKDLDCGDL